MHSRRLTSLIAPVLFAILSGIAVITIDHLIDLISSNLSSATHKILRDVAETIFWLMVAWIVSRLTDVFVWTTVAQRTGRPAPKLLIAVGKLLILLLAVAVIITVIFQQALTGLVVSSGVVGIVLGFALQRMISDFFSGIALSMEHPFHVGDWIEVDGVTGKVVETNWRATHMVTLEQVTVVVPNSFIGERRFLNYNLPSSYFRVQVTVTLEYSVPPVDAKRVLIAAIRATDGVLISPAPDVLLSRFADSGFVFDARFYVPGYEQINIVRDRVSMNIAHHLWQAGFAVPYPKQDVFHAPMLHRDVDRKKERDTILARIDLFESLEPDELRQLAVALLEKRCKAGTQIVKQGDAGASLYVVVDGLLEATVENHGHSMVVGRISPGEFFGEISLFTGSPRGATVTALTDATLYELSHDVISPVLKNRPEVAEAISKFVAIRQLRNSKALEHDDPVHREREEHSFKEDLLRKIRGFFRLEF